MCARWFEASYKGRESDQSAFYEVLVLWYVVESVVVVVELYLVEVEDTYYYYVLCISMLLSTRL